jgi:hypothetical protein
MATCTIRGGAETARRLNLLAEVMAPTTLLDAAGVGVGMSCVDVGCGVGHPTRSYRRDTSPSTGSSWPCGGRE